VIVGRSLADSWRRFNSRDRQIFYFDDFLGSTFLGDRAGLGNDHVHPMDLVSLIKRAEAGNANQVSDERFLPPQKQTGSEIVWSQEESGQFS